MVDMSNYSISQTLELDSYPNEDDYPSDEDSSIDYPSDDTFENGEETPVDKMMRLRALSSESDYFEGRELYCEVCFGLGFRSCTYPCRNSRDKTLIPQWIFVKYPKDHIWFRTCIEAIHEKDDGKRYYSLLMNNERYCNYHPNDLQKCNHRDILTLGYIICHNEKQVSDRYWINKLDSTQEILIDDNLAVEMSYIKEFRDRIHINDLD